MSKKHKKEGDLVASIVEDITNVCFVENQKVGVIWNPKVHFALGKAKKEQNSENSELVSLRSLTIKPFCPIHTYDCADLYQCCVAQPFKKETLLSQQTEILQRFFCQVPRYCVTEKFPLPRVCFEDKQALINSFYAISPEKGPLSSTWELEGFSSLCDLLQSRVRLLLDKGFHYLPRTRKSRLSFPSLLTLEHLAWARPLVTSLCLSSSFSPIEGATAILAKRKSDHGGGPDDPSKKTLLVTHSWVKFLPHFEDFSQEENRSLIFVRFKEAVIHDMLMLVSNGSEMEEGGGGCGFAKMRLVSGGKYLEGQQEQEALFPVKPDSLVTDEKDAQFVFSKLISQGYAFVLPQNNIGLNQHALITRRPHCSWQVVADHGDTFRNPQKRKRENINE